MNTTTHSSSGIATDFRRYVSSVEFEDSWGYPRVKPAVPVGVRLPSGDLASNIVLDISPRGAKLRCDRATIKAMPPIGRKRSKADEPVIVLGFVLPTSGTRTELPIACRATYLARYPDGSFSVGLVFEGLDDDCRDRLERFIAECLTPSTES